MISKKSVFSYVKYNKFLRTILAPLLKFKFNSSREKLVDFNTRYEKSVMGGEVLLSIPSFKSEYYIDPRSDLAKRVIYDGSYESDLIPLFQKIWQGGSVVNIGANVGFWAIALPKLLDNVKKIVAIEPNPSAFALLEKNINHNQLADVVKPLQFLISGKNEEVELEIIPGLSEYSSISSIVHPSVLTLQKEKILVSSLQLDQIDELQSKEDDFSLVLIDVEGAEYLVFQGSKNFMISNRPIVLFECSDQMLDKFGNSVTQIIDFWKQLQYIVIDIETMREIGDERFYHSTESMAIPEEKYLDVMKRIKC